MVVLSCGHVVDKFIDSYEVRVKSESRDFLKAVKYQVVCKKCMIEMQQENLLLDSESDVDAWLRT